MAIAMFYIPMKLHYSQTAARYHHAQLVFYIPMKLHYSQTSIWQYTHYKRVVISYNNQSKKKLSSAFRPRPVCHALPTCDSNIFSFILFDLLYPVEFTCLSNIIHQMNDDLKLLYPVESTCLSNWLNINYMHVNLLYPVEFTCLSNLNRQRCSPNRLLYPVEYTYLSNLLSSSHFLSIHLYFIEFNCLSNLTEKAVPIVWLLCYAEFLIF